MMKYQSPPPPMVCHPVTKKLSCPSFVQSEPFESSLLTCESMCDSVKRVDALCSGESRCESVCVRVDAVCTMEVRCVSRENCK